MKKRREKGRGESFYAHPMGKNVNDILLVHEQQKDFLIGEKILPDSSSSSSIFSFYGGYEGYITAMSKIYRKEPMKHIEVWDKENLGQEKVYAHFGKAIERRLIRNYEILSRKEYFKEEWVPVRWSSTYPIDTKFFMELMLQELKMEYIESNNICLCPSKFYASTKIYMRRSFLRLSQYGKTKILVYDSLNETYKQIHNL